MLIEKNGFRTICVRGDDCASWRKRNGRGNFNPIKNEELRIELLFRL